MASGSEEGSSVREYANAIAGAVATAIRGRLPPGVSSNNTGTSSRLERTDSNTTFNLAADVRSVAKRQKFSPPSLFESTRRNKSRKKVVSPKVVSYVRDVILIPMEFRNGNGDIYIPRCVKRNTLGKAGLIGKIEIGYLQRAGSLFAICSGRL